MLHSFTNFVAVDRDAALMVPQAITRVEPLHVGEYRHGDVLLEISIGNLLPNQLEVGVFLVMGALDKPKKREETTGVVFFGYNG